MYSKIIVSSIMILSIFMGGCFSFWNSGPQEESTGQSIIENLEEDENTTILNQSSSEVDISHNDVIDIVDEINQTLDIENTSNINSNEVVNISVEEVLEVTNTTINDHTPSSAQSIIANEELDEVSAVVQERANEIQNLQELGGFEEWCISGDEFVYTVEEMDFEINASIIGVTEFNNVEVCEAQQTIIQETNFGNLEIDVQLFVDESFSGLWLVSSIFGQEVEEFYDLTLLN